MIHLLSYIYKEFQSTPPCEGATSAINSDASASWFQSTPPCEGATNYT